MLLILDVVHLADHKQVRKHLYQIICLVWS
jgi:hypothetical protein